MALVARNMPHASHTRQSVYRCAPTLTTLHIPHRPAPLALSNATRSAARLSHASALPLSPSAILSEIVDRVYVSDLSCAEDPAQLAAYGITHILSAMPLARTPAAHLSRTRMVVPLQDTPFAELAAFLPSTTAFIVNALRSSPNARVLVHCQMGASRSVSVTAAYLIASRGFSPAEAIAHIKERRAVAAPNWGFVNQLEEYARTLEVDADGSDDETEAH